MSEKVKKISLPVGIGIACTWFSAHCGSGFASGRTMIQYYTKHGWTAVWAPIITWVIMGLMVYFAMEFSLITKSTNYKQFVQKFYAPNSVVGGRVFITMWDVLNILATMIGMASVIAGGAQLLLQSFGIPYILSALITIAIIVLAISFGGKVLMRFSTYITIFLIITIILISISMLSASENWNNLQAIVGGRVMSEGSTVFGAIKDAVGYAGLQACATLAVMIALTPEINKKSDLGASAIGGTILNFVMLMLFIFAMLSLYPSINGEALGILTVLQTGGNPVLLVSYQILLFGALITTGASAAFGTLSRWQHIGQNVIPNITTRKIILSTILIGVGFSLSLMGLVAVIARGFGLLSVLVTPGVVAPVILLGPYRIKQAKKAAAAAAAADGSAN